MELDISPERKLAREDVSKVMNSLQDKGFFVQMPPMIIPGDLLLKNNKIEL